MGNEIFRKDTYTFILDVESTDNNNDNQIGFHLQNSSCYFCHLKFFGH